MTMAVDRTACFRQFIAVFTATLTTYSSGFVTGYSSPVLPQLEGDLLVGDQVSWFGSLTSLAGIAGALICGLCSDYLGRKACILLCSVPYTAGWVLIIAADNYKMLYAGRFLTGVGMGMAQPIASVYVGEVVSKDLRDYLGPIGSLTYYAGLVTVYALGLALPWRWLAVVGQLLASVSAILTLVLPESPRYLLDIGDKEEAQEVFTWLYNSSVDSTAEINAIQTANKSHFKSISMYDIISPQFYRPMLLMIGLMFFNQASGIMAILYYGNNIFINAGYKGNVGVPSVILAIIRCLACLATSFLAERLGRRHLLIFPGFMMAIGCIGTGLQFYFSTHLDWQSDWLPLVSLIVYIAFNSVGWGCLPLVYLGEVFEPRMKGMGVTVCMFTRYIVMFLITRFFLVLLDSITPYGTFFLFAGISVLGSLFAILFVPETKGITVEEVQLILRK